MGIKESFKEFWFRMTHDPNSPEGLRHRAEKIERRCGKENEYARALRKIAKMKEDGCK